MTITKDNRCIQHMQQYQLGTDSGEIDTLLNSIRISTDEVDIEEP